VLFTVHYEQQYNHHDHHHQQQLYVNSFLSSSAGDGEYRAVNVEAMTKTPIYTAAWRVEFID
jgi:hypothetical protein